VLARHGALFGVTDNGTTRALYARDPDGIELEVNCSSPLDLERERQRYGGTTGGGVGISHGAALRAPSPG
jgi:catechol-2,3-dioxygenase